jgi:exosortase
LSASIPIEISPDTHHTHFGSNPKAVVVASLLILAHVPLLFLHFRSLAEWSDYQFFPFAILAAAFLAFLAFKSRSPDQAIVPLPKLAYCFLALSWSLLAFGLFVISSPRAGALAFLSTSVAVLLSLGETVLLRRLLPAMLIYCMVIPLPWNLDQLLVSSLQSLTARESGLVLDTIGIPNIVLAHSVKLPSTILQVEEGCSGINSLFTILITAILYVCWMGRPFIRSLLLLLSAVGAMLIANVLRVVSVGVAAEDFHLDWSKGWQHEVLGLAYFGLALLLVGSMDQLLFWFVSVMPRIHFTGFRSRLGRLFRKAKKPLPAAPFTQVAASTPACFRLPVGVAFGLLAVAQTAWLVPTKFDTRSDAQLVERVEKLPFEKVAAVFSPWKVTGIERTVRDRLSPFGKYSIQAGFELGDQVGSVEIDYPFFGWHNLTNCYSLRGWNVRSSTTLETNLPGQQPGDTVEQSLTRGVDDKAFLLYGVHDSSGRILKRPEKGPSSRWLQAHLLSPRGLNIHLCSLFNIQVADHQVFSAEPEWFMPTLQMQVFVQGLKPLDETARAQVREAFDRAREVLLQELTAREENKR